MELGEETTYEVWVLRYGQLALYSNGHPSAEDAFKHAPLGGLGANKTEVVRVKSIRQRVTPNAGSNGPSGASAKVRVD